MIEVMNGILAVLAVFAVLGVGFGLAVKIIIFIVDYGDNG